jgi:hypothetical protein
MPNGTTTRFFLNPLPVERQCRYDEYGAPIAPTWR